MNLLEIYHMVSVKDMIAGVEACMISSKPESFDCFEKDDLIMSHSLVEYHISKALTTKIHIHFGHINKFKAFPGRFVLLMD